MNASDSMKYFLQLNNSHFRSQIIELIEETKGEISKTALPEEEADNDW